MFNFNMTLVAQIVNFFILLLLLTKLAYKPLLKAMAERAGWHQEFQHDGVTEHQQAKTLLHRLIDRQVAILREAGDGRCAEEIVNSCLHEPAKVWRWPPDAVLRQVSSRMGDQVRAARRS